MAGRATVRWVVRLTPLAGRTVDDLLKVPLSLDVWERGADALVAATSERTIVELERRRIARVERLRTVADLESDTFDPEGGGFADLLKKGGDPPDPDPDDPDQPDEDYPAEFA